MRPANFKLQATRAQWNIVVLGPPPQPPGCLNVCVGAQLWSCESSHPRIIDRIVKSPLRYPLNTLANRRGLLFTRLDNRRCG